MANKLAVVLHSVDTQTAGGTGSSVDIGELRTALKVQGDVVAASGTSPSLGLQVQTSPDGTSWRFAAQFPSVLAPAPLPPFYLYDLARYVRLVWTIGGTDTPSFTFSLSGEAHTVYARRQDSRIAGRLLDQIEGQNVAKALIRASSVVESYLGTAFTLPLLEWGDDIASATASIADYELIREKGLDPDSPDVNWINDKKDAIRWLKEVSYARAKPSGIVDSDPIEETGAYVVSRPKRGWVR
jgi:phage gp36-like protein